MKVLTENHQIQALVKLEINLIYLSTNLTSVPGIFISLHFVFISFFFFDKNYKKISSIYNLFVHTEVIIYTCTFSQLDLHL